MVLRLMKNPSDEQRRPQSRPKLLGAVKRIVATTKEYVEAWRLEEVETVCLSSLRWWGCTGNYGDVRFSSLRLNVCSLHLKT